MNQEILITEPHRVRLLNFSKNHLTQRYIDWLNNQEVVQYSELRHTTHTLESGWQYWQSFQNKPHLFWAIEIDQAGEWLHIGNINAYLDENNKIADVGILIGERLAWGKGYGSIAWQAMCHYLFTHKQIRKITAGTMSINKGMLKIMQKVGMIEDGRRMRQYVCNGQEVDICHYALFKNPGSK